MRNPRWGRATMAVVSVEFVALPSHGRVFRAHSPGPPRRCRRHRPGSGSRLWPATSRTSPPTTPTTPSSRSVAACGWSARAIWRSRALPRYHEEVELATFCSGTGPRWAERRTQLTGDRGALVEVAALWVFVDRAERASARARRRLPHASTPSPPAGDGSAAAWCTARRLRARAVRPWPLRASDFDVLDHVNNARSLEAVEDELVAAPSRSDAACARGSSTGAPSNAATPSSWPARCRATTGARRSSSAWLTVRRRGARLGDGHRRCRGHRSRDLTGAVAYTDRALDPMPVESFAGRRCLVTGGLGFIGSNLALALARGGAEVTVIDARVPAPRRQPRQPGARRRRHRAPDPRDRGGGGRPRRRRPRRRPRRRRSGPTWCSTSPGR